MTTSIEIDSGVATGGELRVNPPPNLWNVTFFKIISLTSLFIGHKLPKINNPLPEIRGLVRH